MRPSQTPSRHVLFFLSSVLSVCFLAPVIFTVALNLELRPLNSSSSQTDIGSGFLFPDMISLSVSVFLLSPHHQGAAT